MSETNGGPQPQAIPQIGVLAQYVKDLSFENPNAPRSMAPTGQQPTINIQADVQHNAQGIDVTGFHAVCRHAAPALSPAGSRHAAGIEAVLAVAEARNREVGSTVQFVKNMVQEGVEQRLRLRSGRENHRALPFARLENLGEALEMWGVVVMLQL